MTDTVDAVVPESTPSPRSGLTRRRVLAGTAWAAPTIALAQAVPAFAASPDFCATPGTLFDAQARGRLLSGSLLSNDLDNIAELEGAHAEALEGGAPSPVIDTALLTVNALNAISVNLDGVTTTLSELLSFVTNNTSVATLNQYARAHEEARTTDSGETGAAGAVSDSGALALNTDSTDVPELATLDLYKILHHLTGPGVAELVDQVAALRLIIGAVAGRAFSDSLCTTPGYDGNTEDELERDYLVAGLRTEVQSDLVGDLSTEITGFVDDLEIDTDDLFDLLDVVPLLGSLLSALAGATVSIEIGLNTDALNQPLPSASGNPLQVQLNDGLVIADLAALLGGAYTGEISPWLNSLAANSRLFIDQPLPTTALSDAADAWLDAVVDALRGLIDIRIQIGDPDGGVRTGLRLEGTLGEFLDGSATTVFRLLSGDISPATDDVVSLLGGIAAPLLTSLETLAGPTGPLRPILLLVNEVLADVFTILETVVVLTLNAQNAPDNGSTPPDDFAALEPGRYDVAALHVGAADLGQLDLLDVFLARGSIGANEPRI